MHVASLELCKTLHELSGWKDGVEHVYYSNAGTVNAENVWPRFAVFDKPGNIPAYSLGYLLRKLPGKYYIKRDRRGADWWAYKGATIVQDKYGEGILAEAPEDAACKLAIELFKQGILTK